MVILNSEFCFTLDAPSKEKRKSRFGEELLSLLVRRQVQLRRMALADKMGRHQRHPCPFRVGLWRRRRRFYVGRWRPARREAGHQRHGQRPRPAPAAMDSEKWLAGEYVNCRTVEDAVDAHLLALTNAGKTTRYP